MQSFSNKLKGIYFIVDMISSYSTKTLWINSKVEKELILHPYDIF